MSYVCEASQGKVAARQIELKFPLSDSTCLELFKTAIASSRSEGKRPRVAIFDTIVSVPGIRLPFEALVKICTEESILSCIDGAHGVGQIELNLSALDPDFFVSNCYKWLYVPHTCAVFYVPLRNQHLIRSTVPTGHGFVEALPQGVTPVSRPPGTQSDFVTQFTFVAHTDRAAYLCVPAAIEWRKTVCGGETAIMRYCSNLALEGGKHIASRLGTKILDNEEGTMTKDIAMVNVMLPLRVVGAAHTAETEDWSAVEPDKEQDATRWMLEALIERGTYLSMFRLGEAWWVRVSAQIYLSMADFEWMAGVLLDVCAAVGRGEYLEVASKVGHNSGTEAEDDMVKDEVHANA